jgi:magnesium chelatase subunit D
LLAVDPQGLGGIALRSAHGPAVQQFLSLLRRVFPSGASFRRLPLQIADSRLLGGLDLAATLQSGRPILERGLLADADGGCIVIPMAERLSLAMASRLVSVLDNKEVVVERDGFSCRLLSRVAIVALDEGASDDEAPPLPLLDRLAVHLSSEALYHADDLDPAFGTERIAAARATLPEVIADDGILKSLCHAAAAVGIDSIRAPMLALKVACAHAALSQRNRVVDEDAIVAARLVLAPRAKVLPEPASESPSSEQASSQRQTPDMSDNPGGDGEGPQDAGRGDFQDVVISAVSAAIPDHLLARIQATGVARKCSGAAGRAGAQRQAAQRGRPTGVRRGDVANGARLNIVETLRAAAPWQKLRRGQGADGRVRVTRDDFRIVRFKQRSQSATIFVVDASGSSALHRLAEAKGAVELLLADCYVRRDQVAVIAFRGSGAELVLPPTRSLARAKRSLAAMPGGGGTPIASAIDAASMLASGLQRKGFTPTIVLLTDGRANVTRDGAGDAGRALVDALASARNCRALQFGSILVDTSATTSTAAARLATEMGARYLPLPRADASTISRVVRNTPVSEPAVRG